MYPIAAPVGGLKLGPSHPPRKPGPQVRVEAAQSTSLSTDHLPPNTHTSGAAIPCPGTGPVPTPALQLSKCGAVWKICSLDLSASLPQRGLPHSLRLEQGNGKEGCFRAGILRGEGASQRGGRKRGERGGRAFWSCQVLGQSQLGLLQPILGKLIAVT